MKTLADHMNMYISKMYIFTIQGYKKKYFFLVREVLDKDKGVATFHTSLDLWYMAKTEKPRYSEIKKYKNNHPKKTLKK